jgi:hypothetical protein
MFGNVLCCCARHIACCLIMKGNACSSPYPCGLLSSPDAKNGWPSSRQTLDSHRVRFFTQGSTPVPRNALLGTMTAVTLYRPSFNHLKHWLVRHHVF